MPLKSRNRDTASDIILSEVKKMKMLTKEELTRKLCAFYQANFDQRKTEVWFEQPAANVWVFGQGNKIITLKCHLISGEVTQRVENKGA